MLESYKFYSTLFLGLAKFKWVGGGGGGVLVIDFIVFYHQHFLGFHRVMIKLIDSNKFLLTYEYRDEQV